MNKIKVYVYKNDFGHLLETFEKLTGNYAVGRTFLSERTITLDTPEVKEERLSGWLRKKLLLDDRQAMITPNRHTDDDTRMIQINEGEIIVSEDEAYIALSVFMCDPFIKKNNDYETYLETLGFKKDGV